MSPVVPAGERLMTVSRVKPLVSLDGTEMPIFCQESGSFGVAE